MFSKKMSKDCFDPFDYSLADETLSETDFQGYTKIPLSIDLSIEYRPQSHWLSFIHLLSLYMPLLVQNVLRLSYVTSPFLLNSALFVQVMDQTETWYLQLPVKDISERNKVGTCIPVPCWFDLFGATVEFQIHN